MRYTVCIIALYVIILVVYMYHALDICCVCEIYMLQMSEALAARYQYMFKEMFFTI